MEPKHHLCTKQCLDQYLYWYFSCFLEDECCCSVTNHVQLCNLRDYSMPGSTISWSLLKFMSIESVMPSNHLILCHSLLLLPSVFPSIRVFSNESALHIRWPEYWSFSFSNSPSNEYSELISFRIPLGSFRFNILESSPASQLESINSLASVNS